MYFRRRPILHLPFSRVNANARRRRSSSSITLVVVGRRHPSPIVCIIHPSNSVRPVRRIRTARRRRPGSRPADP
eukprot:31157-Pelagococcus_subviridis.AAC.1